MKRTPNVITVDATIVDASGVIVPRDIDNTDVVDVPRGYEFGELDSYSLPSRSIKSDWVVKIVNDANEAVDLAAVVSTADDAPLQEWTRDGPAETAATGSSPDNVVHLTSETVAGHLGAELTADPAPTSGTITVLFGGRAYGGA